MTTNARKDHSISIADTCLMSLPWTLTDQTRATKHEVKLPQPTQRRFYVDTF